MRRLLLSVFVLAVSPIAAMAQNTICATAPFGDSSNRCASTAFVQVAISGFGGNPTALVGLTPKNGSASTYIRSDGAPALDQGIAPVWTGAHTFTGGMNVSTTSAFTISTFTSTDSGAANGPLVVLNRSSSSPDIGDGIGGLYFQGNSSTSVLRSYTAIENQIVDPTNASEDGRMRFLTINGGAFGLRMMVEGGVIVGSSGVDPGAGSLLAITSVTSPIVRGGTAPSSILALQSTSSGAPNGDRIEFHTANGLRWKINGNVAGYQDGSMITGGTDWLEPLIPSTTSIAQLSSISPYAGFGVLGASRTSDLPHLGFSVGVAAFAINDRLDGTEYYGNLSTAYYAEARHQAGVPDNAKTLVQENDIITAAGSTVGSINPFAMNIHTANLWLSNGRPDIASGDATVAIGVLNNTGTTTSGRYSSGLVFHATSLLGTDGLTGTGTAVAMARGHQIVWYTSGQSTPQVYIRSSVSNIQPTTPIQGIDFFDSGIFFGAPNNGMSISTAAQLTIGSGGASTGSLRLAGATSGAAIITPPAAAGTPTLTLPIVSGTFVTNSNNLSVFASTTSAQLAALISDETGSGSLVFGTSPTFTTGITVNGTYSSTGNITSTGSNAIFGHTAAVALTSSTPRLQVHGTGASASSIGAARWSGDGFGPFLTLNKSRGATIGTHAVAQSGDILGEFAWGGDDGTNFIQAAIIRGIVDGTPGTNDMPGALAFLTTSDGSASATERMRISQNGTVNIIAGLSANGSAGLSATKTVRDAAGTGSCTLIYTYGVLTGGTC